MKPSASKPVIKLEEVGEIELSNKLAPYITDTAQLTKILPESKVAAKRGQNLLYLSQSLYANDWGLRTAHLAMQLLPVIIEQPEEFSS